MAENQSKLYNPVAYNDSIERTARQDRIFLNNPVIMQGLGLAPLIVACTSGQNALMISVAVILILVPARVIAAVLSRFSYYRFRGLLYSVVSASVYVGVYWIVTHIFPAASLSQLGLYLPLLVIDPIVIKRYERVKREKVDAAFRKSVITALGYSLVLMIMGILRELLAGGTFFGNKVFGISIMPMLKLPMGGFMLLAVVMALWRGAVTSYKKQMKTEAEQ
jgi:Na+-translocating ferredoxin:NAD+ oxidoreductase subunit E